MPCIFKDDMSGLLSRYIKAETVVFASPVYFYSLSATLKIFVERLMPLTRPLLTEGSSRQQIQNSMHVQRSGPKRCVLVCVAGHREPTIADGLKTSFLMMADALGLQVSGILFRPESFFFGFPRRRPGVVRAVREAVKMSGRELVENGAISDTVERAVSQPLTQSTKEFMEHYNNYWQIAGEKGFLGSEGKKIRKAVNRDMRSLMPSLEWCFDPESAKDLQAVFQFELTGEQPGTWSVEIANGQCDVRWESHEKPDVVVKVSSDTLTKVITGSFDAKYAIQSGRLVVEGDTALFRRFSRLFSKKS